MPSRPKSAPTLSMKFFLNLALGLFLAASLPARDIGEVRINVESTIPIRIVASSPDLQSLALTAFNAHQAYDITGRRAPAYELRFSAVGAKQVRVDIMRAMPAGS